MRCEYTPALVCTLQLSQFQDGRDALLERFTITVSIYSYVEQEIQEPQEKCSRK